MIELRDVTFGYDDESGPVLRSVDLEVDEGELVLVAGRTGVGKSTLLGVVPGLVPRFTGGTLRGDVLVDEVSVVDLPPRERAHLVGYVGQNPVAGFVTDTVEEELAYGMEQLGLAPATMRRRVEETLDLLGIADLRARDLRALSGGQQQRVAIGSVLAVHPRLLVLDEPTSALDPTAAEEVLATLTRLVHDVGLSVLLAEHRLERVVPFADRTCLLVGDGTVRVGETAEVLRTAPVVPPIVDLGRRLGWDPLPLSVREARRAARRTGLPAAPRVPAAATRPPVLRAEALTVAHGRRAVLRELDLALPGGAVTALMGRNGAGKSTLLWALQGSRKRYAGTVAVAADLADPTGPTLDPAALAADDRVRRVGLVPQTAADLLYLETVAQECAAADDGAGAPPGASAALLESMAPGIDPERHPRDLSEGQRLALVLAVVLVAEPPVVLLDEPTRGLDYPAKEALAATLGRLAGAGHAVLVASHDVEFVARVADRVVVLADGEVVSSGPVRDVLAESPSFAPQVAKIAGERWLTVDEVVAAHEQSHGQAGS
ncbi:ATP-binding cassette domain-containing protein [Nocardioides zeae]|uniref:ATP-binding cassette domain-containing protein n=1 Tax=Nocardioides imazamoxiresistens TaxID=3231893 RepID=A0ABU3PRG4_9ACTN|nr:ATP-binding cassette domain-containing protein [Nocardioides zeae]MDT9591803.1 ATP-binding cassette domain-containing protein [Nocardioides zeae]